MGQEKLFFDVYELAPSAGSSIGIYNYAKHLFHALVSVPRPGLQVVLVCNESAAADFVEPNAVVPVDYRIIAGGRPGLLRRLGWTYFEAAFRARAYASSIYFSPRGFLPYFLKDVGRTVSTIVTVHDLIPLWYREHFPLYFGRIHQWFICSGLTRAATKADLVVTISEASAADIRERTRTTVRIRRIYNGVESKIDARFEGIRKYFLAMTSALPHKNAACILEGYKAYRQLSARPLDLVVCGLHGQQPVGVRAVTGLSDAALRDLYAGARTFVFMSLAEGFGFPPLEAMAVGTETICSDIPVLREVTHGAATYVDPGRPDLLAQALLNAEASSGGPANEEALRSVVRAYSWLECADEFFSELGVASQPRVGRDSNPSTSRP